jgi:MSHA biogenesis protein MshL
MLPRVKLRGGRWALALGTLLIGGCAVSPPEPRTVSEGHLGTVPVETPEVRDIPEPVRRTPFVPLPEPAPPAETYTVVVHEVPVKELLFALARDASVNVDVHPEVTGTVTLNAVDQTLPAILDRIARQLDIRHESTRDGIFIEPDRPVLRSYRVDYVNMARDSSSVIETSTNVATVAEGTTGGEGGNRSDVSISNVSNNRFWETLLANVGEIVRPGAAGQSANGERVFLSPESGVLMVRGTAAQHRQVQAYLDQVVASVHRQVLIEATIVEVELSDRFQSGIDWARLRLGLGRSGLAIAQAVTGAFSPAASGAAGLLINLADQRGTVDQDIDITVRLLKEFGDTQVLSSPKIMALNNQPAILRVVDNEVYFTVSLDERESTQVGVPSRITVTSTVNTVPVGLVMSVTPQVDERDVITLNVRPTITRIRDFVNDPGVAIIADRIGGAAANVANRVPVVQVRETETVLRVPSRQIAVLGGLMQDRRTRTDDGTPGLSDIGRVEGLDVGGLFEFRDRDSIKTELVIFLRASVIRSPSVDADLADFRRFLPENLPRQREPVPTPLFGGPADGSGSSGARPEGHR